MTDYRPDQHFPVLLPPYTVLLKDGETTATIYPITNNFQLPQGLLAFLADEFNMEIERGDTFPFFDTLDIEEFKNYWFGAFAAVMVLGDEPQLDRQRQWEKECLGTFFIKANFPGRASHICTGGFLVNAGIRGKGIGKTLTECFLDWAPKIGFTSAVFNLIFETNVQTRRIFESLNFKRIGKIKSAGILKDHEVAVDAIIYGKELVHPTENPQGTYRFDKIKYYLETGRYPPLTDRSEKSRLRSNASHYKLINGKLTLNGREVIPDPIRQLQICTQYHAVSHGGINKTTTAIADRYHWTRIKDTVAQAIRNCDECRDPMKSLAAKKRRENINVANNKRRQKLQLQQQAQQQQQVQQQHAQQQQAQHNHHLQQQQQQQQHAQHHQQSPVESHHGSLKSTPHHIQTSDHDEDPQLHHQQQHHHHQQQQQHHQQHHNIDHTQQDIEAIVAASSHLHRTDSSLLQADLTNLDDPSGIFAAVEAAQRSRGVMQHDYTQDDLTPNHHHHHQQQHHQQQQSHDQQNDDNLAKEYSDKNFYAQQSRQFENGLNHYTNSNNNENDNVQQNDDIPVDPEVSAFDDNGQNGEEIEIAKALIQANESVDESGNGQESDGNDLFN
ncbi:hypothetical protein BN7_6467 [Wickerhamomyces ciferrii]|uniref:N-acetyltransferase domain-containing protein n=1 Tax=Wickerhamomyces ciferrii (strain ATCC 14091 / BCRC 22168 / CBS 111 / JCM 3599 / NBRC 0793 / NRRL Y-1031 F-60-10) TaxID=1206466 RepID=K0KNM8_WICCF|nr:uncharacterized protein BN7_6467 [Wickerhamomyces ciferrii]CCH46865.1 hypothetical protein BN7_6467 [Wickerhamomyces ciferrii]